jgi:hypothetical protein
VYLVRLGERDPVALLLVVKEAEDGGEEHEGVQRRGQVVADARPKHDRVLLVQVVLVLQLLRPYCLGQGACVALAAVHVIVVGIREDLHAPYPVHKTVLSCVMRFPCKVETPWLEQPLQKLGSW